MCFLEDSTSDLELYGSRTAGACSRVECYHELLLMILKMFSMQDCDALREYAALKEAAEGGYG